MKGAVGQDGQVTILDLSKAHGIPYMEVSTLNLLILFSRPPSARDDGKFQPHFSQKGLAREYNSHGLEYFLGPYQ